LKSFKVAFFLRVTLPRGLSSFSTLKMALNARSKKYTLAQSLMSSDDAASSSSLSGVVQASPHTNLDRMSHFLGLGTVNAMKEWMQSTAFKPHFDDLYNSWLKPQQDKLLLRSWTSSEGWERDGSTAGLGCEDIEVDFDAELSLIERQVAEDRQEEEDMFV
jgi:hypothetical protein